MMVYYLGKKTKQKMAPLHEDGKAIIELAITYTMHDFGISQVERDIEEQRENIMKGVSTTLKSRHLPDVEGTVYAWDIYAYIDGKANYEKRYLRKIAQAFFRAAFELGYEIEWGGHWGHPLDMPHFQLSWRKYPAKK